MRRGSRGRRTKLMGLTLGSVTATLAPARIEGVEQRGSAILPEACPKCAAAPPAWILSAALGWCRICGTTWYRTIHTRGRPKAGQGGNPRAIPPHLMRAQA